MISNFIFWAKNFLNRLLLKPHGNHLLTNGGSFWVFGARLLIFIMALVEGLIWGYLGSFFGGESFGLFGAIITGTIMFVLIWIVDATFITLDTSRAFYERKLKIDSSFNAKKEISKLIGGILTRIIIVSLSLVISAPYLAQMVLNNDIENKINQENQEIVSNKRNELMKPLDTRIINLQKEWDKTQRDRVLEAAGKGASKKYGRGDATETIEMKLSDLENQIEKTQKEKNNVLNKYDSLSFNEKIRIYNLEINNDGLKLRNRIIEDFKNDSSFISANYAVKAFLVFLFIGLLVLKIFQPRSIRIYYNEQLQDLFQQYRLGHFDLWLDNNDSVASGKLMTPMRFEDWCVNTYSIVKKEDENNRFLLAVKNEYLKKFDVLKDLYEFSQNELRPMLDRKNEIDQSIEEGKNLENELSNSLSKLELDCEDVESQIVRIEKNLNSNTVAGKELGKVLEIKNDLIDKLKLKKENLLDCKNQIFKTKFNLNKNEIESKELDYSIKEKKKEIVNYEREILELRNQLLNKTLSKNTT